MYLEISAGLILAALDLLFVPHADAQAGGVYSLRGTIASGRVISGRTAQMSSAIGQVTGDGSPGGVYVLWGQELSAVRAVSDPSRAEFAPADR